MPTECLRVALPSMMLTGGLIGGGICLAQAPAPATVFEAAHPRHLSEKIPSGSAVCFSSRWKRPANQSDPHDTFRDAARFHATHMMWVYVSDPDFVREARARGYVFQASLNPILSGRPLGLNPEEGRLIDTNGNLLTAPWMASWKDVWWGCVNSDEYRRIYLHHAKVAIDGGADMLQQDDPGFNYAAVSWGACYCPYCKQGFEEFRKTNPNGTMRDFQEESVRRFYADMLAEIDRMTAAPIPKSSNNYRGQWAFYHELFDFGVAELPDVTPESFLESQRVVSTLGKAQVFTAVTKSVRVTRLGIAMACATGASMIVPWDVYMGSNEPRYFGTPEQYADLYGFIRGCAEVLDGYSNAGVFSSGGVTDNPYTGAPPVTVIGAVEVYASVRAIPGGADRPVAIHLVDWSEQPARFDLMLQPKRLFGDRPVRVELWTPTSYDPAIHDRAEVSKEYSTLVSRRTLASGAVTQVSIDPLGPYGVVVVSPMEGATDVVWPAAVELMGLREDTVRVTLSALTPGAEIRYSTDGSMPGPGHRLYDGPIDVSQTTDLSARVFADGRPPSEPVRLRLEDVRQQSLIREPNHADLVGNLKLWLRADDVAVEHRESVHVWPAAAGPDVLFVPHTLYDGRMSTPPCVAAEAINGRPVVRFARETDLLSLPGFASQAFGGKAFTFFVVSQSSDPEFGLSGNAANGGGGIPRLYLMRQAFVYDQFSGSARIAGVGSDPQVLVYEHDGDRNLKAFRATDVQGQAEQVVVPEFGAGGALSVPFWAGNKPHPGDLAEVAMFDRLLTEAERNSVVAYLDGKYRLGRFPIWELRPSVGAETE